MCVCIYRPRALTYFLRGIYIELGVTTVDEFEKKVEDFSMCVLMRSFDGIYIYDRSCADMLLPEKEEYIYG